MVLIGSIFSDTGLKLIADILLILQILYILFVAVAQNSPSLVFLLHHENLFFEDHSIAMMIKDNARIQD